jgi:hypothetical protein
MLTLVLVGHFLAFSPSARLPGAEPPPTDQHGDPLPEGALARLGTLRLRPGQPRVAFAVSPDSRTLASGEERVLRLWDLG